MKLLLHIAAGAIVGWVVIVATQQMLNANRTRSVAEPLSRLSLVTVPQPRPTPAELSRVEIQQPRTSGTSNGQPAVVESAAQR